MKKLILCFALLPFMVACDSKEAVVNKDPAELPNPNAGSDSLFAEGYEPGKTEEPNNETGDNESGDNESGDNESGENETAEPAVPAGERMATLLTEFDSKMEAFRTAYEAAESRSDKRKIVDEMLPKPQQYKTELLELVRENPEESNAVDAWLWLAKNSRDRQAMKEAMDTLLEDYADSDKIGEISLFLMGDPNAKTKLEKLISSPHDSVKGAATYAMASMLKRNSERDDSIAESDYLTLFKSVVDDYPDLVVMDRKLAEMAASAIFEIEHLTIGKEAPDIEGEDLDGVAFKLSDYRGKVIMLDFWGDW